ncbi:MAG: PEP-CTERM sorting domain-containing protein [Armatimonadetes bacterium]|nr:PEP-CTERM sorting domain-containing protein [Armatimonadota bacterium]
MKKIIVLFCAFALTVAAWPQGVINDGNARWEYNAGGSTDFQPDSGTDHLFLNWWWYRVNSAIGTDTQENRFPFPADSQSYVANVANMGWAFAISDPRGDIPIFDAGLRVQLNDGASPGEATVRQEMLITNTSTGTLSISIFNFADFDVGGSFAGDSGTMAGDIMTITDVASGDFIDFFGDGANAFQVVDWPGLTNMLDDAGITNLDNTGMPYGGPDFTGAFQWNLSIPVGQQVTINEGISANVPIPEPATLLILGGALAALAARRRRK